MNAQHLSVVIPTYNRAAMLAEAIHSVLTQTVPVYEIIVADDGSTDETAATLSAIEGSVRHLTLPHSGRPSVARNRAIEQAKGALVAFLDDDDLWEADKVERCVAALDDPCVGFVYSDARLKFEDGSLSPPVHRPPDKAAGDIFDLLLGDCPLAPSAVVVRRDLLITVGSFDERLEISEDYDLWLRLARQSAAAYVDLPLVQLRRHPNEISVHRERASFEGVIRTLSRLRQDPTLNLGQRRRIRQRLAQCHAHLAQLAAMAPRQRRAHAVASLRYNPLQRAAWRALRRAGQPP